jgi:hypothetical protein
MSGESNLDRLLENMRPEMQKGDYAFITSKNGFSTEVQAKAVMIFREQEGITAIVRHKLTETISDTVEPKWAMITLTVHSDLAAIGFLAAITRKLADAGISVNPVSAYYHDHLFVPYEKRERAMEVLQSFSKKL